MPTLKSYLDNHESETYATFADKIGIEESSVWRIANFKMWPKRDTMVKIIRHTHGAVTANDLIDLPKNLR